MRRKPNTLNEWHDVFSVIRSLLRDGLVSTTRHGRKRAKDVPGVEYRTDDKHRFRDGRWCLTSKYSPLPIASAVFYLNNLDVLDGDFRDFGMLPSTFTESCVMYMGTEKYGRQMEELAPIVRKEFQSKILLRPVHINAIKH